LYVGPGCPTTGVSKVYNATRPSAPGPSLSTITSVGAGVGADDGEPMGDELSSTSEVSTLMVNVGGGASSTGVPSSTLPEL
jgi:hypothetical protein